MKRQPRIIAALATCFAAASLAFAGEPTAEEKLFDPPLAIQDLEPIEGPHPAQAVRCHWYGDFMIRETNTDSPGFGPSYVVHPGPGGARPVCRAAPTASDTKLDMESQALLGRKGPYLVFETTDANGPEPFLVVHLPDGRQIYDDKRNLFTVKGKDGGFHAVTLDGDLLHLKYSRGYDAPCSLIKDGAACWARTMKEGHFARAVASQPPPIADCVAAYKGQNGATAKDASTIVYDVDMTVTPAGKVSVLSRGPVGCLPPN